MEKNSTNTGEDTVDDAKVKVEKAKAVGEWAKVTVVVVGLASAVVKLIAEISKE